MNPVLQKSAFELADLIRQRSISPVEVVDAHIARIEAVNPRLNALVARRYHEARKEARAAEEALAKKSLPNQLPPLFGVPCTLKDFIAVEGMPQTGGLVTRRETRATADATVTARVRAAGAIVLGVTNVPEGGLWLETHNRVYGRTNNPWDPSRTCGGSSGGEGALVAAGAVPFGIGSDIGGSIRIPAALCGAAGHKPTGRMVPNTGIWPGVEGERSAYHVAGPIARRVRDLLPLLKILAGPDGRDSVVQKWPLEREGEIDLRRIKIYPVPTAPGVRVDPAMQRAVSDAAAALESRGASVIEFSPRKLRGGFPIWSAMLAAGEGASYLDILGEGAPFRLVPELLQLARGRSTHTAAALVIAAVERLFGWTIKMGNWAEMGRRMQAELETLLGDDGVLLHPPYSRPAPRHNAPLLRPFDFVCTGLFNVLEFPGTVVPLGFSRGLPVGVQVIGRRGADALTIGVAAALEEDFGGWVPAPC